MLKPYVVSIEAPSGLLAVTFDANDDTEAFSQAARIVAGRIAEIEPDSVVEIMRPDATPIDARPTAEWMARFAKRDVST